MASRPGAWPGVKAAPEQPRVSSDQLPPRLAGCWGGCEGSQHRGHRRGQEGCPLPQDAARPARGQQCPCHLCPLDRTQSSQPLPSARSGIEGSAKRGNVPSQRQATLTRAPRLGTRVRVSINPGQGCLWRRGTSYNTRGHAVCLSPCPHVPPAPVPAPTPGPCCAPAGTVTLPLAAARPRTHSLARPVPRDGDPRRGAQDPPGAGGRQRPPGCSRPAPGIRGLGEGRRPGVRVFLGGGGVFGGVRLPGSPRGAGEGWEGVKEGQVGPVEPLRDPPQLLQSFGM